MTLDALHPFNNLHSGMPFEIRRPGGSSFGDVRSVGRGTLMGRLNAPHPDAGRVGVRIPLIGALFTAEARLSYPNPADSASVILDAFTDISIVQRRDSLRLHEPVRATLRTSAGGQRILPAVNLSPQGVLLGWPGTPEVSLQDRISISLDLADTSVLLDGIVIRIDGEHTAVRFTDVPDSTRDIIVSYVSRRERRRKLVDDPFADQH